MVNLKKQFFEIKNIFRVPKVISISAINEVKTSRAVIVQPSSNASKPLPQKPTTTTQTKARSPSPIEALPPTQNQPSNPDQQPPTQLSL